VRKSPLLNNGVYARDTNSEDDRFIDYYGAAADIIIASSGTNDSGMFETNLKDERFLPFEGAGAICTWTLSLPSQLRSFDYMTISDVILHIRYTARQAGDPLGATATKELAAMLDAAGQSGQALMFSVRYDFPTEWSAFVNGSDDFKATLQKDYFPYMVQNAKRITIETLTLYAPSASGKEVVSVTPQVDLGNLSMGLNSTTGDAPLILQNDDAVLKRDPSQQVFMVLQYHFGMS
jgi:hypothetical protein